MRKFWIYLGPSTSYYWYVSIKTCSTFSFLTLVKADRTLPSSGSLEEHLKFLSSLRDTHNTIAQRQSTISHQSHTAHEVTKLQELWLTHTTNTLNALEDVIGEVRARFQARGIPLYLPQHRCKTPDTRPTEMPGTTITSDSSMVEEVIILFAS